MTSKKLMIDCFIFYNEIDLLTYRLNILNEIIDYFIIVESTHTFVGKEKKLYFNENKHLYDDFKEKIIHIIVKDMPYIYPNINISDNDQWKNENFQRNCIIHGLNSIAQINNDDIIIIGDADEIPDPITLTEILLNNIKIEQIYNLEMDLYYYNLTTKNMDKWYQSKILSYKILKDMNVNINDLFRLQDIPKIKNGGWHLSYFGDKCFIYNKLISFSHQEFNIPNITNLENIQKNIETHNDLFYRDIVFQKIKICNNKYLPIKYEIFLRKFYSD